MAGLFVGTLDFTKIFIFILLVSVAQVEIIPQLCIKVVQYKITSYIATIGICFSLL
jgi:hypothetical protein